MISNYQEGRVFEMPEIKRPKWYKTFPCIYNENVDCRKPGEGCNKCGWNPKVAQARTEAFEQRFKKG